MKKIFAALVLAIASAAFVPAYAKSDTSAIPQNTGQMVPVEHASGSRLFSGFDYTREGGFLVCAQTNIPTEWGDKPCWGKGVYLVPVERVVPVGKTIVGHSWMVGRDSRYLVIYWK